MQFFKCSVGKCKDLCSKSHLGNKALMNKSLAAPSGKYQRFGMPLKELCVSVCLTEFHSPEEVLIKFLKLQTWNSQSYTQMDVCVKLVLLLLHAGIFSFQMSRGESVGLVYGYL